MSDSLKNASAGPFGNPCIPKPNTRHFFVGTINLPPSSTALIS